MRISNAERARRRKQWDDAPAITLYGLKRARNEGWELKYLDGNCPDWCGLYEFRRQGAVIVAIEESEQHRSYWFGLPPYCLRGQLRELAAAAGMIARNGNDIADTLRWYMPTDREQPRRRLGR